MDVLTSLCLSGIGSSLETFDGCQRMLGHLTVMKRMIMSLIKKETDTKKRLS